MSFPFSISCERIIPLLLFISISSFAQIEIVSIYRDPIPEHQNKSARTGSLPAQALPFWDDFSFNNSTYYPNNKLWENSNSVWVNSGMGINPPSLNVATFDGYDSLGKPYSVSFLAKGFADKMTSVALKLGDVPAPSRSSVFISFFYQFAGNGEAPEPGDKLTLLFKNNLGQWEAVWEIDNNGTLKNDEFVQIILPIDGDKYFHNDFQFRFQNFGRLSGPYDTWNLDYVYVNQGRTLLDLSYPDRTITSLLTSLFQPYWSIPFKHFFANPTLITQPTFNAYNLRIGNDQPLNHFSSAKILAYKANTRIDSVELPLDNAQPDGSLLGLQRGTFSLVNLPPANAFDQNADSVSIQMKIRLTTKDNLLITNSGDYDPSIFSPIDFRHNDTIKNTFLLSDFYAYDDGIAEYGAKITGVGTQLAYQFDMVSNLPDTIVAMDLYFPKFGDDSNQNVQLHIMSALTGNESDYLHRQNLTIQRSNQNKFLRVPIPIGVPVLNKFYVGWKLNSSAVIAIGLDRNTNSGDKMFVNVAGQWEQNISLVGSLMIRPVFGTPPNPVTAVADVSSSIPYPNPTQRSFYLSHKASQIKLYDLSGNDVAFEFNDQFNQKEIIITHPTSGLYLVRYFDKVWHHEKIMVRP